MNANPKFISSDRSQSQIIAIKSIFPGVLIVFFRVHLRRVLLKFFDRSDPVIIIIGFNFCYNHPEKCNNYIEILKEKENNANEEAGNLLNYLLSHCDNWFPSKLIEHGVFLKTNGVFKIWFDKVFSHSIVPMFKNYNELLLVQS